MKDYCISCQKPLQKLELGKGVITTLICTNHKCNRMGLLTVVSTRVKKKEVGKNEIRTKNTDKQNGKKSRILVRGKD